MVQMAVVLHCVSGQCRSELCSSVSRNKIRRYNEDFSYSIHCFMALIISSLIFGVIKDVSKYDDLKFYFGIIDYVGYPIQGFGSHIPVTVNVNSKREHFHASIFIKKDLNKIKIGNYIEIGTWKKHDLFFIRKKEIFDIKLNRIHIYNHLKIYKKAKSTRLIFITFVIIMYVIYIFVMNKTSHPQ